MFKQGCTWYTWIDWKYSAHAYQQFVRHDRLRNIGMQLALKLN